MVAPEIATLEQSILPSQPKDSINTLGGVVSALALSFVLGLQYMVAPGTDEMQYADFRSLICKSQEPAELSKGDRSVDSMLQKMRFKNKGWPENPKTKRLQTNFE